MSLTNGALAAIYHGTGGDLSQTPTVQILSCKKVSSTAPSNGQPSQDRYRIIVSDGDHFMQAMLATQNNHLVESGRLDKLSILRLDQYACNVISNRKIIIMLGVHPISSGTAKIGDPKSMEEAASNPAPVAQASAPAATAAAPQVMGRGGPATRGARGGSSARGGRQQQSGPSNAPIYPIEGLSPYQNKWTIKARVVNKSDIKHWSNAKGEGKLFSVTLMDETGEIRATGFNDAVDNLYNIFEQGKVYFVSKARVNIAKKQFNNVNNEYEIAFGNDSEAELCTDTDNVPEMRFDFVDLSGISELEKDQMCDILAVVKEVGELGSITSKATQRPISKRDLVLVDKSSYSIRMTLWGKSAETFEAESAPVIAFRGVKVGDFGGRSLSMVSSSTMMVEPDISSAHELRGWYDSAGHQEGFQTHSSAGGGANAGSFKTNEAKTITEVKDEGLGMSDTPQYFDVRATTVFIKQESFSYPACPADRCNKKLVMEGNDEWRCEKCDRTYPAPEYRYVLSLSVGDHSGQCWLSGFNDVGQLILGVSAGELEAMRSEDEASFRKVFQQAAGKTYNFGCRAKSDTYNDQMKVRYQIQRATAVNWVEAGKSLIEKIAAYGIVA